MIFYYECAKGWKNQNQNDFKKVKQWQNNSLFLSVSP